MIYCCSEIIACQLMGHGNVFSRSRAFPTNIYSVKKQIIKTLPESDKITNIVLIFLGLVVIQEQFA